MTMDTRLDILKALSEKYVSIHVFDLINDTVEMIKTNPHIEEWIRGISGNQAKLNSVVASNATEESKTTLGGFVDLSTLEERLADKNVISTHYQGYVGGWCRASFFRLGSGEKLEKVVYTVENINDTMDREKMILEATGMLADSFSSVYWISVDDGLSHNLKFDNVAQGYLPNEQTPTFESLGRKYMDTMIVPEDVPGLEPYFDLANVVEKLKTRDQVQHAYRTIRDGGRIVYYRLKIVPFDDGRKFVLGFEDIDKIYRRDIEQKEQLTRALEEAEAANRAKTTFLFNMSHDIRTPLNAIIGFTDLAAQYPDDLVKIAEYREKVSTASRQLLDILNNVLEMARIENQGIIIEEDIVDTMTFFDSWTTVFEGQIRNKNITFTKSMELDHNHLYIDSTHMTELLMNVLSNAVKYTPDGGRIFAGIRELPSDNPSECIIETTIRDTGIGMSEEFQRTIFEEFARERNTSQSGVQGTGLGMAIVKRLVDLMDGTITINSKVGEGTEVILRIPHRIGETVSLKEDKPTSRNWDFSGRHILLVEDIEVNALLMREVLSMSGATIDWAKNGVECIDMLNKSESGFYDVILMDIQMPVMNGYQATYRIRSLDDDAKANIPIIALSANAFKEDIEKSRMAGMNDHLAKPIDINLVNSTLAELFDSKEKIDIRELLEVNGFDYDELQKGARACLCIDDTRRITLWNEASVRSTGYKASDITGKHCFFSGLNTEDEKGVHLCAVRCPLMETILDGRSRSMRVSVRHSDGQRHWVNITPQPLYYNGVVRGALQFISPAE